MTFEQAYAIRNMHRDMCTMLQVEEAMEKSYWVKISVPDLEPVEIQNGELSEIFHRHIKEAFKEMRERIAQVSVDNVEEEIE